MGKIVLLDKEYDFYIRLWSKLQTVLGDKLFARVDSVIMFEREQDVFGSNLEIYKPDRSYTETYSADINAQSLEFISENISSCDCGFTAEKLNLYYQFLIDSLSKLPYSVERINF